jgi:hypothetical protein
MTRKLRILFLRLDGSHRASGTAADDQDVSFHLDRIHHGFSGEQLRRSMMISTEL